MFGVSDIFFESLSVMALLSIKRDPRGPTSKTCFPDLLTSR